MLRCTPFLLFDGNCAEAMAFYHGCLGGTLMVTKLRDTPMRAQFPPEKHDRIINAQLKSGALEISATDWMASPALEPRLGNMSAIFVIGNDFAELKVVFDKLGVGADRERFQDLHEMPFGIYGQFYDRYGVQWIFRGDMPKQ
jgi:PhnB protein